MSLRGHDVSAIEGTGKPSLSTEAEIISKFLEPLTLGKDWAHGLRDDAACITPRAGHDLVLTKDALVAGVHFFADDDPRDIAAKALGVNVSDLVAKAAHPIAYLMALALPGDPLDDWLERFCSGFADAQSRWGGALIGGDLVATPGPLTISITAIGEVASGRMVERGAGRPGDKVYVTGTIGDAALGLVLRRAPGSALAQNLDQDAREFLLDRYLRPDPPIGLIDVLREHASAALDVSDGLAIDFARMCAGADCGGRIAVADIPLSDAVRACVVSQRVDLEGLISGGDDYEVLAAVPSNRSAAFEAAASSAGVALACIGELAPADEGVAFIAADGAKLDLGRGGYDHF